MKWAVTKQSPTNGGVQVEFTTEDGQAHELYVSNNDYNTATIKKRIAAMVATKDEVAGLTSES